METDVVPVDAAAVARVLAEERLEHRVEGEVVRTGFANAAIAFAIDQDYLVCEALWRGVIPAADVGQVLYACNEYNQSAFAPTLKFFDHADQQPASTLGISASRVLDVTCGASVNQLGAFVVSTLDAILSAFDYLAATFPAAVTWQEPHDEH
ncbi:YbjN domain-containing protein [Corynebacterium liangguodongii]|uniref:YbjN domain-containing protein n=1 Tax=Corynebacterium liangguodongii TaxID=2079535 RepID=UPI001F24391F|nr:YbjN domain-containing protein [Corynebacterium liangguodongii]